MDLHTVERELQTAAEGATRSGETVAVSIKGAADPSAYHCEIVWTPPSGGPSEPEKASWAGTSLDDIEMRARAGIAARRRRVEDEEDAEGATRDVIR